MNVLRQTVRGKTKVVPDRTVREGSRGLGNYLSVSHSVFVVLISFLRRISKQMIDGFG